MQLAREGIITPQIQTVADKELRPVEFIRERVADGRIVIPANINHKNLVPMGIGRELLTKINANIGNSAMSSCPQAEKRKLDQAIRYGADTVMDLSTGGDIDLIRRSIIDASPVPVGTVPIYEVVAKYGSDDFNGDVIVDTILSQAKQGVDYMTIHPGLLRRHVPIALKRVLGIVSRGGSLIARWMQRYEQENPFYSRFDDILNICLDYDVTLVEGPGHVPFNEIEMNMKREQEVCGDAPFYILGPVVIDCAPGYDHIVASIGGTAGAYYGAAMLCYVTPMEHLGLPEAEDVRNGVIAFKIAAHAADVALKKPGAVNRDNAIGKARAAFDWEKQFDLALDPDRAREYRKRALDASSVKPQHGTKFCTMCGPDFCSMRISSDLKNGNKE